MNTNYQTPFRRKSKAADFRLEARTALKGRWGIAVVAFIVALALGMSGGSGFSFNLPSGSNSDLSDIIQEGGSTASLEGLEAVIELLEEGDTASAVEMLLSGAIGFALIVAFLGILILSLLYGLFVGAPATVGYHRFNLDLLDRKPSLSIGTIFYGFKKCYLKSIGVYFMLSLIQLGLAMAILFAAGVVLVFSIATASAMALLLVFAVLIFGAAATFCITFRYALCYYILAEYPELGVMDVLRNSASLMKGNKWRLFCLEMSFIGWYLLAACCTCGLGVFVVAPYSYAATAAFYYEITGHDTAKEVEFPSVNPDDYFPEL